MIIILGCLNKIFLHSFQHIRCFASSSCYYHQIEDLIELLTLLSKPEVSLNESSYTVKQPGM